MHRLLLAALAATLIATPALAQEDDDHHPPAPRLELPAPALNGTMSDAQIETAMSGWLTGLAEQGRFSGVVLIARDGRAIYTGAYGQADRERGLSNTADTSFNIASIGKAYTQAAVQQLIGEGRLSMSMRIGDVIPDYPNETARAATVEQLLTHRGGIGDFFGPAFMEAPKEEFASNHDYFEFVARQPLAFAPGEGQAYCNGCYVVLGEMIARVSGLSYEDYIAQNVYARAGMRRAGFFRSDQPQDWIARPYGRPNGADIIDVSSMHGVAGSAAGGSYANASDLLALDNAMREHRLFGSGEGRITDAMGIAGGAPGVNAVVDGGGRWTVIVLANQSPPIAEAIAQIVFPLLAGEGSS